MKKITELTKEQESKFEVYRNNWIQRGLTTTKKNHSDAVIDFTNFQKEVLKMNPAPVVLLNSPFECWIAVCMASYLDSQAINRSREKVRDQMYDQVDSQVRNQVSYRVADRVVDQVKNQVSSQVNNQVNNQVSYRVSNQVNNQVNNQVLYQVDDQVNDQVYLQVINQGLDQVYNQVNEQVRDQVRDQVTNEVSYQVYHQVWNQVWNQVQNQVWNQVQDQVRNQVYLRMCSEKIVYPYLDCQFWAGFFSFSEFCRNELNISYTICEKAYDALLSCQPYGMVWPLKNLCVVCQPPTTIKKNNFGLHCEDGPALSYNGHNEIYALNGVVVPKELVMTPEENLSIDFFKSEKNADVKAEFVRKFGVERMLDMGKKIDTFENYDEKEHKWWHRSQYELHDMGVLFGVDFQPYLKMLNQTTGIWHMEAVSPACRNLKAAIKERFGGRDMKIVAIA